MARSPVTPMRSFRETVTQSLAAWLDFYARSWELAGSPPGLSPDLLIHDPIQHNATTYRWIEQRHGSFFIQVNDLIQAQLDRVSQTCPEYVQHWLASADLLSIWKQLRPLTAFAAMQGGSMSPQLVTLGAAYAFYQGVPSMNADSALDTMAFGRPSSHSSEIPFAVLSTIYARELLAQTNDPELYFSVLTKYAREMYERMWVERSSRYRLPSSTGALTIDAYVSGSSRILSSVFHSICLEFAYAAQNTPAPPHLVDACRHLRRVRQLNDEIADVGDDFASGLCTLPILIALQDPQSSAEISELVGIAWPHDATASGQASAEWVERLYATLNSCDALGTTARHSLAHLQRFIDQVYLTTAPTEAFEVALLIGQRITHLLRMCDNAWRDIDSVYYPTPSMQLLRVQRRSIHDE